MLRLGEGTGRATTENKNVDLHLLRALNIWLGVSLFFCSACRFARSTAPSPAPESCWPSQVLTIGIIAVLSAGTLAHRPTGRK
jgi:hypothetical protein